MLALLTSTSAQKPDKNVNRMRRIRGELRPRIRIRKLGRTPSGIARLWELLQPTTEGLAHMALPLTRSPAGKATEPILRHSAASGAWSSHRDSGVPTRKLQPRCSADCRLVLETTFARSECPANQSVVPYTPGPLSLAAATPTDAQCQRASGPVCEFEFGVRVRREFVAFG